MGGIDALNLRSAMTLFHRAAPDEAVFSRVLEWFFGGAPDPGHGPAARGQVRGEGAGDGPPPPPAHLTCRIPIDHPPRGCNDDA